MTTFRWISLAHAQAFGIADLIAMHWEDIEDHRDVAPLDIDWSRYRVLEKVGQLKIGGLFAPAFDGETLVGYNIFFVHPLLHHRSTLWAISDGMYLDPEHRRGAAGIQLITEAEAGLRAAGAKVILYSVKADDLAGKRQRGIAGKLLPRLGYQPFDQSWSKVL